MTAAAHVDWCGARPTWPAGAGRPEPQREARRPRWPTAPGARRPPRDPTGPDHGGHRLLVLDVGGHPGHHQLARAPPPAPGRAAAGSAPRGHEGQVDHRRVVVGLKSDTYMRGAGGRRARGEVPVGGGGAGAGRLGPAGRPVHRLADRHPTTVEVHPAAPASAPAQLAPGTTATWPAGTVTGADARVAPLSLTTVIVPVTGVRPALTR